MAKTIQEERVKTLLILGDLTDNKDNHPSELVNRIVRVIRDLQRDCVRIIILTGNHDWLKNGEEFFRFLNHLENVTFVTSPWEDDEVKGASAFFLPYSKHPARDWKGLDFSHYEYLFMHQTVKGAISSNGQAMEGEELPDLNAGKVYSGDIHVPQVIGGVEYVGSPYHVHFGDDFLPRAVLLEKGGNTVDLHFKTIKRVAIKAKSLDELTHHLIFTKKGDHVKATIRLPEAEKHEWSRIRREATELLKNAEVEVHGLALEIVHGDVRADGHAIQHRTPEAAVLAFIERESLTPEAFEVAMEVIEQ